MNDLSTIIVILLWLITLTERTYRWYVGPHRSQNKQIKGIECRQIDQENRTNRLAEEFAEMQKTLNKIKDNHLVHLQEDVNKLKESNIRINTNLEWIINKLNGQE